MQMVVAVENGLGEVARQLREKGYTIVSYPEYAGVVDAFIYKAAVSIESDPYDGNGLTQSLESGPSSSSGVLLINATNKDLTQIENILRTRVYSPLF